MKSSIILGAALTVAPVWGQGHTLTSETIEKMGNNSLFDRWRPTSHFLAPAGWMNVGIFFQMDTVVE
jgi:beta-fructofuranosidase